MPPSPQQPDGSAGARAEALVQACLTNVGALASMGTYVEAEKRGALRELASRIGVRSQVTGGAQAQAISGTTGRIV